MRVTFTGVRLWANSDSPLAHFAPVTIARVGIQPSINTPHSALFIAVPPIPGRVADVTEQRGKQHGATEERRKRRSHVVLAYSGGPPACGRRQGSSGTPITSTLVDS